MSQTIASLSLSGGLRENFYFCLLEFFPDQKRWFLKSVLQMKDEPPLDSDEILKLWIEKYNVEKIVVDFPLTRPECATCTLECPGANQCPVDSVREVRTKIQTLLDRDEVLYNKDPKDYERKRIEFEQVKWSEDIFQSASKDPILSRPFKRKLRKGYLPYWNRPVDYYIWQEYYDQMLKIFNNSFDSFGHTSQMLLFRIEYLKRHLPAKLLFYESHSNLVLMELFKKQVISKDTLMNLNDLESSVEARLDLIRDIEPFLNIFIYDHDLELLVKSPKAFQSFLLCLAGQSILDDKLIKLPEWAEIGEKGFVIPNFS